MADSRPFRRDALGIPGFSQAAAASGAEAIGVQLGGCGTLGELPRATGIAVETMAASSVAPDLALETPGKRKSHCGE
ncbi:MAG: hypothetical protein ABSD43_13985 [Terracidiphilus sp.]|jgi:hypothetical protein